MSLTLILALTVTMVGTAFLSGIFGMAGGLILIGILLALMPLPDAMALHAVTQMASNGWRSFLWIKYVSWRSVANFMVGSVAAFALWSVIRYVPSKPMTLIALGATPFMVRLLPADLKPDPERLRDGALYGSICMTLILLTGATGPLIDSYFLGGKLDRRQVVASKAFCQTWGHGAKYIYFGSMIDAAATLDWRMAILAILASMTGTTLARPVLERLTDTQFRTYTWHIITVVASCFLLQGTYLLALPFFQH